MLSYKRCLRFRLLFKKCRSDIFKFLPKNNRFFFVGSARGGLEACIDALGFTKLNSVLIPAFVPEGVISPFKKKGINVKFYKSNYDLSIDIEDLKYRIESDTTIKAVVIIHYFGFPQSVKLISRLCKENNIVLFEDCAQAIFSKDANGIILGSTGDIAFFSFPKSLPVPDGSLFLLNNLNYNWLNNILRKYKESILHLLSVMFHFVYLLLKNYQLKLKYSFIYIVANFISKVLYAGYYQLLRMMKKPVGMSKLSKRILENINYKYLIDRRRFNAKYFYANIDREKHKLVFQEYNENYVLTGIPILVDNRDIIIKQLQKKGIDCLKYTKFWNFIPQDEKNEFINEINFLNNHFLIPINENINKYEMKYIIDKMNSM